jgi:hypothetical protein
MYAHDIYTHAQERVFAQRTYKNFGEHHPFRTLISSRALLRCYNELTEVKWICLWYDVKPLKICIQLVSQIYK